MNRKEFYEYVKDNVKTYLPKSYEEGEIKLQEIEKNIKNKEILIKTAE